MVDSSSVELVFDSLFGCGWKNKLRKESGRIGEEMGNKSIRLNKVNELLILSNSH